MTVTWGEFKKRCQKQGLRDHHELRHIRCTFPCRWDTKAGDIFPLNLSVHFTGNDALIPGDVRPMACIEGNNDS